MIDIPIKTQTKTQTKTDVCESCGNVLPLFNVSHHQEENDKVWRYCQKCKTSHEIELAVNEKLKTLMAISPQLANDPNVANQIRNRVVQQFLKDGKL